MHLPRLLISSAFILSLAVDYASGHALSDDKFVIRGAGASSVQSLFEAIFESFRGNRSVSLHYDSLTSGAAAEQFVNGNGALDFIVGERFVLIDNGSFPELVKLPVLSEALVLAYNIPGVSNLNLTMSTVAGIYYDPKNGLKFWNDSRIQAANSDVKLPEERIIPIVRSMGSGQTRSLLEAYSVSAALLDYAERWLLANRKNHAPTAVAMATTVGIVAYSIGYMDLSAAMSNNLHYVKELYNLENERNSSLLLSGNYTNTSLSTHVYLLFNKTRLETDCCKARELVGFLNFLTNDSAAQKIIQEHHFNLLPGYQIAKVRQSFESLTCAGGNVLSDYMESLKPKAKLEAPEEDWKVTFACVGGALLFLGGTAYCAVMARRHHRNKIAEERLWTIPGNKLKLLDVSRSAYGGRHAVPNSLQFTMKIGMVDEGTVFVSQMDGLANPKKWSAAARAMVAYCRRDVSNSHVLGFHGIVAFDDRVLCVMEFCGKGTIHHVLTTTEHEINDAIKFNLALDVAHGMNYLQKKQITHGMLNSLTCYIDFKWTVKISNWLDQAVYSSANSLTPLNRAMKPEAPDDMADLILLIYSHPKLLKGEPACANCDIYSFAMLLAELFTNQLPFTLTNQCPNSVSQGLRSIIVAKRSAKQLKVPMLPSKTPVAIRRLTRQCICTNQHDFTTIHKILRNQTLPRKGVVDIMMEAIQKHADHLEEKVARRTAELDELSSRMKELLHQMLPREIAVKLSNGQAVEPEHFDVSVLFLGICDFTTISAVSTPAQVMALLNQLWNTFDEVIEQFDAYKADIISDTCMVCSGVPKRNGKQHARHLCGVAKAIMARFETFEITDVQAIHLKVRIGINSGPVTAGIVGNKMPRYCVFGDTINSAAGMEQTSLPLRIHVAETTAELIQCNFAEEFSLEPRGDIDVKGEGTMKTYWLLY